MSDRIEFPWQALSVVCDGLSILDIDRLDLKNESEAYQFLLSYGYDLYEPNHVDQIKKIYDRALQFIETYLCCDTTLLPETLKQLDVGVEIRSLLVKASGQTTQSEAVNSLPQYWVCAVLRVMHAISHLQSDLRLKYLPKIKRQSVDRLAAHIQKDGDQLFLGFEADKIPLVAFQKKESKVRDSILIKLLHKASATAQEIYDHIGVRYVAKTRYEALRVIKYLIDHHLIAVPNVLAVRCRNTLIPLQEFRTVIESGLEGEGLAKRLNELMYPLVGEKANPFSADDYHSIQFTARQLIRIPVIRKGGQRREMTFFFPIEIQIFDEASFNEALTGEAAHLAYKQKQLDAVRKRVLKGVSL